MKKIYLIVAALGLSVTLPVSAQLTVTDLLLEAEHADVSLMDWDNDGDLDLLISGEVPGPPVSINRKAYLNNGTGTFTEVTVPFTPITRGSFSWDDVNGDGRPDLLQNGFGPAGAFARIYNSNGTGTFTENPLALPQLSPTSGFADFNNDGYVDIYIFGNDGQGKAKILFNDKIGGFVDQHSFDTYSFTFDPDVTVVDFDNDKDLDMFISAGDVAGARFSRLFKNNNGVFTEAITLAPQKGYGGSTWGDYDGDGFLDILMNGSGVAGGDDFKYKLYKNNGGNTFTEINSWIYGQFSTGDGGRFFDWDNDGDLDFIATGWTGSRQATAIYINSGGTFTEYAGNATLPGVSESSIEVGDINNDSDLDIIITGFSGNDFDGPGTVGPYNRRVALVLNNPATTVNVRPNTPTGLVASGNQATLTLSWNAATDATTPQAALSYNLFLVNSTGRYFYYPLADTTTGKLALQKMGNVQLNKSWVIKGLPAGTYRWGVQAVDNSFMGSLFAKSNFTINPNGSLPITLLEFTAVAEGKRAKIEWATSSELNNDRFEIERSADGAHFTKMATVKSQPGTANIKRYQAYDNAPLNGINYYRLAQVDVDNKKTIHGIKTVNFRLEPKPIIAAYPNPSIASIGLRLSNYSGKTVSIVVTDVAGKVLHKQVLATTTNQGYYKLNTAPLKPGQYLVKVMGDDMNETIKAIVQ